MNQAQAQTLDLTALAAALALAAASVGLAACSQEEEGRATDRSPSVERQQAASVHLKLEQGEGPPVRMELAAGARLDRDAQAELAAATQRFATTLAAWLYGDRREVDVEALNDPCRETSPHSPSAP